MNVPAGQGAPAGPQWRRPLIAAAITLVLAIAVLAFGYERMSDQADDTAGAIHAGHAGGVTRAASGTPGASGNGKPARSAPAGAASSP
jgi:hypothetical protein